MTKSYQWYYQGVAIGGATGKTHTLTSGQTDSNLIECRTEVTYGTDSVAALAEYAAAGAFTDSFTYSDQDLANTGNWAVVNMGLAAEEHADCGVVSNQVTSQISGSVDALFAYTGGTPANDQYAQCVVKTTTTTDTTQNGVHVLVRSADADNGYYAEFRAVGRIRMYKIVAGVDTLIGDTTTSPYPLSVDDVLRLEVSGASPNITLVAKHNGTTALTVNSQSDHASGRCGIGIRQDAAATTSGQIALDDFECGDL